MKTVKVLPKTYNFIRLHAEKPLIAPVQDFQRFYHIELSDEVIEKLENWGADINDPESIHDTILKIARSI